MPWLDLPDASAVCSLSRQETQRAGGGMAVVADVAVTECAGTGYGWILGGGLWQGNRLFALSAAGEEAPRTTGACALFRGCVEAGWESGFVTTHG